VRKIIAPTRIKPTPTIVLDSDKNHPATIVMIDPMAMNLLSSSILIPATTASLPQALILFRQRDRLKEFIVQVAYYLSVDNNDVIVKLTISSHL
jgi:hypothetical protein